MSGILIPGALQFKTSRAWTTSYVTSFTLPDKASAIVKVTSPLEYNGSTNRRVHDPVGGWSMIGGFYTNGGDRDPVYSLYGHQAGIRLLRVGATLYQKAIPHFDFLGATPIGLAGAGNGLAPGEYTGTLSMDGDGVVTGSVPAWPAPANSDITEDVGGYDYQVVSFEYHNTFLVFSEIQIFYSGF